MKDCFVIWAQQLHMHIKSTTTSVKYDKQIYLPVLSMWNGAPKHQRNPIDQPQVNQPCVTHEHNAIFMACMCGVCVCFVYEPTLQDGHKLPKWKPHSCCGVFIGFPPITPLLSLSSSTLKQERSDHNFMLSLMTCL